MQIRAKWDVSKTHGAEHFTLDDLGVTLKEWREMSDAEKEAEIQKGLDSLPEQPYMQFSSFQEY